MLLAGCTDIGLWVNKQLRELDDILYLGRIEALRTLAEHDGWLHIGAAVTLTEAFAALSRAWPELAELWAAQQRLAPHVTSQIGTRAPDEPHRRVLLVIAARIAATRTG